MKNQTLILSKCDDWCSSCIIFTSQFAAIRCPEPCRPRCPTYSMEPLRSQRVIKPKREYLNKRALETHSFRLFPVFSLSRGFWRTILELTSAWICGWWLCNCKTIQDHSKPFIDSYPCNNHFEWATVTPPIWCPVTRSVSATLLGSFVVDLEILLTARCFWNTCLICQPPQHANMPIFQHTNMPHTYICLRGFEGWIPDWWIFFFPWLMANFPWLMV